MKQFVTRHWSSLLLFLVVIGFGLLVYLTILKEPLTLERVQVGEDKWAAKHVSDYRIRVKTMGSVPGPSGTNIYEMVVRNGLVSESICIESCIYAKDGPTVPELFQKARKVITNDKKNWGCFEASLERCLLIRYDATYGYPTLINYSSGYYDKFFVITILSFEVLK